MSTTLKFYVSTDRKRKTDQQLPIYIRVIHLRKKAEGKPTIINTDQGSQYTSEIFTNYVKSQGVRLSMDGKGRATDNAFIERLWRNVKYEKLNLNPPKDGIDLYLKVQEYFNYYNHQRRHEAIDYEKPIDKYRNVA